MCCDFTQSIHENVMVIHFNRHLHFFFCITSVANKQKQTESVALVRERTIPTERLPLVGEVSASHVVSATDPHGRYCFFQVK
jgi:hypothetical protein